MNEQAEIQNRERGIKAKWFFLGVVCQSIVLLIGGLLFIWPMAKENHDLHGQVTQMTNMVGGTTVLEDFQPTAGMKIGPVLVQPQLDGKLVGETTPRWVLPFKIEPVVIGDPQNARYLYVDYRTHQTSGPFVPNVIPSNHYDSDPAAAGSAQ